MNQKQYRILIVEDDKAIRTLIETALEDAQLAAISAYNGASAVSQVRTQNPDVILLDLGLPDMDGIQVVDEIRRITINPIIIVSARSDDTDKIEALNHGADDDVTKPLMSMSSWRACGQRPGAWSFTAERPIPQPSLKTAGCAFTMIRWR